MLTHSLKFSEEWGGAEEEGKLQQQFSFVCTAKIAFGEN